MRLSAAVLLLASSALSAQDQPALLFIGIDGLRPDYVLEADRHGLRIPNLRRFLREGAYATRVTGVFPTVTFPSFTTLITGVAPAVHGIVANNTFDPLQKNQNGWYWYAEDVRVATLWHVAGQAGRTTANVHWPVSVGAPVTWNLPQIWRAGTPDDRKLLRSLATPGLLSRLEQSLGEPYADGIDESLPGDENRGRFAVALLAAEKPRLMTAYFTALDHEQHDRGPFAPEAFAVLERIDAIVGRLVGAARQAFGGRVVIAVASDHGFSRTERDVNLGAAFISAALVTADTTGIIDWRATVWAAGGSAAIVLKDSTDVATRREVSELLTRLAADSANGISSVLDGAELRRRGSFTGASYAVVFRPGHRIGGGLAGALVTPGKPGGTHGFLPDGPGMKSTFLVIGPGVPAGHRLGEVDIRDVAPTLASLVGLKLPGSGRPLVP